MSETRGPWTATPALIKIDRKGQINYLKIKCNNYRCNFPGKPCIVKHNQQYFFSVESSGKAAFQTENFN